MKYAEMIVKSKEEKDNTLAPARAEQEKARLGIARAELGLQVKTAKNALESLKGQFPLPVDEIIEAGDSLALDERRLAQLDALSSELFGS
jgi:hypothetical protein